VQRWWLSAPLFFLAVACGPTDPPLIGMGEPCSPTLSPGEASSQCRDGLCVALDSASGFCTGTCSDDASCPANFRCEAAGRYGKICKKLTGCIADAECPSGHSCNPRTGNCYLKVQRTLCSPCQDDLQCPEGGGCFTARGTGEQFCTTGCLSVHDCPQGFDCRQIPLGADGALVSQCVPTTQTCNAGKSLCTPCLGDSECGGFFDLCVRNVVSGETFCGTDCHPERVGDCPEGFFCVDLGQSTDPDLRGPFQCVPVANTCVGYCSAQDEAGQVRECGLGQTCNADAQRCEPATDGRMCAPCTDNDDCRSGGHPENRCIVNDCPDCPFKGEAFCSTTCADDPACIRSFGPGFVCRPVVDGAGVVRNFCMPQRGSCAGGLGRIGEDCSQGGAQDCLAGVCLVAGSTRLCSAACTKDSQCGDTRFRCCEYDAQGYDCAPARRTLEGPLSGSGVCAPMGGLFGDDCTPGRPPCQTGACLDLGTSRVCTQLCALGCPEGFSCRPAEPMSGGEAIEVCFPLGGGLPGADCTFGPAACESGLCIRKDSGPLCTMACGVDGDCPASWRCDGVATVEGLSIQACVPPSLQ
jgi:hypothetical protein